MKALTVNLPTFRFVWFVSGRNVTSQGKNCRGSFWHRYHLRCNLGDHALSAHGVKYVAESSDLMMGVCEPCLRSGVSNWTESRSRPGRAKHLYEVEEPSCTFRGIWGVIKRKTGHSRSQEQWMEVWVLGASPRVGGEGTDMPVWNRGGKTYKVSSLLQFGALADCSACQHEGMVQKVTKPSGTDSSSFQIQALTFFI